MRRGIQAAFFCWLTPVLAVGAGGFGLTRWTAIAAGALAALASAGPTSRWFGDALVRDTPVSRPLRIALALAAIVAVLQIASLSVFMADVRHTRFSIDPDDDFRRVHSCASAYAESVRFLTEGAHNIYHRELYRPNGAERSIGPLRVDPFHYPPPFLLLPQAIAWIAPDFWDFRRLWFAMQALVLLASIVGLAGWIGGRTGAIALLGGLLVLALPHAAATLQVGNFQLTAFGLAAIAFVLLVSGRHVAGGGVLAYAALGKIFPGVLLVPLIAARRWRAVAGTAAMGIVVLGLAVALQGLQPFRDFVTTSLPEISSGAAFPQTESPAHARVNWSAYGQTVRLRLLGVSWLTQSRGLMAAELYGVVVVALALWAGWKARFDLTRPEHRAAILQLALALASLASFRSPFVGGVYGCVSTLWVLGLLAARATNTRGSLGWLAVLLVCGGGAWTMPTPASPASVPWLWITGALITLCMAVNVWGVIDAVRCRATAPLGRPALAALM